MEHKNVWEKYDAKQIEEVNALSDAYRIFLDKGKTERECIDQIVNRIEKDGYIELEELIKENKTLKAGDKVYSVCMNKSIVMYHIGKRSMVEGLNILGAHIDSPRLDVKQNPLYEDGGIAYLDTHYYGGVKKYQWVTLPLALHGVIVKKDGTTIEVNVGEDEDDPVFFVSDLLIHLAGEQLEKKAAKVIEGEALDIVVGNMPIINKDKEKEEKEAVKKNVLQILKDMYDIEEEDFLSAEIEVVPAGRAREAGFDRSMVLAYGHDDRVCAYPAEQAIFSIENPDYTAITVLTDKEETGSDGNTGLQSSYLVYFINDLAKANGLEGFQVLSKSECLSADVNSAYDPTFNSVFEKNNTSYLNKGVVITKYTGARGKSGTSDASAEYMGKIRNMLDKAGVIWQIGELGKVDAGGGGTVAKYIANLDVDVVDLGVPVLSMHAPYEVISKLDLYMAYRAFTEFFKQ